MKKVKKAVHHTTFRNNKLFCLHCGGEFQVAFPCPVEEMTEKIDQFNQLHRDCKKTWVEPQADQSQDVSQKAMWWIANGHVGLSSKTMWNCLMGNKNFPIHFPIDPDDFDRCYKLLQAVPEWKSELHKLKPLSKQWNSLVENWDKLTEMYERNVKEDWKNYRQVGMYEFMQKILS